MRIRAQFYSWYNYPEDESELGQSISSAEFIDNVNQDPVVIVNGLTKVSQKVMGYMLYRH